MTSQKSTRMKLQEFFDTKKHILLTDTEKLDCYQSFLYKKTKKNSLKRWYFVHAKYFVYSMIFVILMMGMYGVYFINNGDIKDYSRFAIQSNSKNTVQADYIAQVIEGEGKFFIEHNGVLVTTNNIGNGDTILLKEWAQLVFEINSGTQSKIIGPAKLVLQKTSQENYKLNLIYGDFIQMKGKEQTAQTIELAINDITVQQEDTSKPLNFKFVKNGKNQIFQNNGANIIVTKNNEKNKSTTVGKLEVIAIQNNDIKLFANIESFTKAIKEKNISQTFALAESTKSTTDTGTINKTETLLSLLSAPRLTESDQELTKSISLALSAEKKILDPEQDEKVNSSLYEWFYTPEIQDIEKAFIHGDDTTFVSTYSKIEKRIQTIYQAFDAEYTKTSWDPTTKLQWLREAIRAIKQKILNEYNTPPKYIQNLDNIDKLINNVILQWYGSSTTHNSAEEIQNIQE